jgi:hypothetical protein
LLFRLAEHGATGTLRVEAPDGTIELLYREGSIRFASSTRPGDRMLSLLARQGLISELQAEEVENELSESGRRAGAILLDRGWIKPAELIPNIREHLEHLVMEVFGLEDGAYVFRAEWPTSEEIVCIEREPAALVFAGIRRKYEPERVKRLLGASEVRPLLRQQFDELQLAGCPLTGKEWRLVEGMDGKRTLGELGESLGFEAHTLWSLAFALHCLGLVSLPAESAMEDADAKEASPSDCQVDESDSMNVEIHRILRRLSTARDGSYFEVLGVSPDATAAEIGEAYCRILGGLSAPPLPVILASRFSAELEEIRIALQDAFDVLGDHRLRERYSRFNASTDDTEP